MEELGNTWYIHNTHDCCFLLNYIWWTIGSNDNGKY